MPLVWLLCIVTFKRCDASVGTRPPLVGHGVMPCPSLLHLCATLAPFAPLVASSPSSSFL